jgi:hypothetical protein
MPLNKLQSTISPLTSENRVQVENQVRDKFVTATDLTNILDSETYDITRKMRRYSTLFSANSQQRALLKTPNS